MAEMLAARSDRDFVTAAPARPRHPAKREPMRKAGGRAARALAWTGRVLLAHPREIVVGVALLGGASAIAWNALAVQTTRHPSPLFGRPAGPPPLPPARPSLPAPAPSAAPAAVPSPPAAATAPLPAPMPRAASRDAIADLIRNGDGAPGTSASRATVLAPPATPKPTAVRDDIGELIRASGALVPPANVGPTEAPERVAAGQRALTKLGYGPLKADGIMGPGTRQAIERFERDRRLAVTGEFGSRTARELAAQSGLPVE